MNTNRSIQFASLPLYLRVLIAAVTAALLIGGCTQAEQLAEPPPKVSNTGKLTGSVSYRERMALTPDAELSVKLLDVSKMDVAATEIAAIQLTDIGQVPINFELDYDPALIDERMSYSIRAEISDRGRRMFTTDTSYRVITRGHGTHVDMTLIAMQSNPIAKPDASLTETYWKLISIKGEPYKPGEGQREVHLRLRNNNNEAAGFSGCNNFAGTYTLDGDKLSLGPLAMTMMACIDTMELERNFGLALSEMNRYEIEGDTLRGYAGDEVILRFEAVYLE